jgi:hypothetical protein
MQVADTLQATRPSRESTTGWTQKSQNDFSESHDSLKLNERGPALNVFWSRLRRDLEFGHFLAGPEANPSETWTMDRRCDTDGKGLQEQTEGTEEELKRPKLG